MGDNLVTDKFKSDKKSEIKMIGGPIVAIIERIQINIKDK
jgi:hypothetical protein